MENRTKTFVKVGVVLIVSLLVTSSTTAMSSFLQKEFFSSIKQTIEYNSCSSAETELKYYREEGLSTVIGVCSNGFWKSAIRLTQDEMAAYSDWTMTKVNVAFSADNGCPYIYIRIYIYDKGSTSTIPGSIIVNDTIAKLDTTGITTVPLVTPVNLSGHEELWVAVEWNDTWTGPGVYYAWLDTITGPHVPQKGDFCYLNNVWSEMYTSGADFDGNWGIGAIVEGLGATQLSIGNIKGLIGITAEVSNIGGIDTAKNVSWSIAVTGGLFHKVTVLETGILSGIGIGSSVEIDTGVFFGFGKITISITAGAENALEVSAIKTAYVLGPFVVGIKDNF
jgi:hypothetical protein